MTPASDADLLVACLCARWCTTCEEYRNTFDALAQRYPKARLRWIDIEDEDELVGDIEVENFPTVLIALAGVPVFFGTLMPHPETLDRLLRTVLSGQSPLTAPTPELLALLRRLC